MIVAERANGDPCGPSPDELQQAVARTAESRLRSNPYLALKTVSCQYSDGMLTLRGCLPSFYLKQMAQCVVGDVEGVRQVNNQIEVVSRG